MPPVGVYAAAKCPGGMNPSPTSIWDFFAEAFFAKKAGKRLENPRIFMVF